MLAVALVLGRARDSIVFFNSPTDVVEKQVAPGTRIRLGGLVKAGSIARGENLQVRFDVTDGRNTIPVAYQGLLPDLFREGQGVVTEGALDRPALFRADSVLAKHDENYMPQGGRRPAQAAGPLEGRGPARTTGAAAEGSDAVIPELGHYALVLALRARRSFRAACRSTARSATIRC